MNTIDQSAKEVQFAVTSGDDLVFDVTFRRDGVLENVTAWTFRTEVRNPQNGALLATLTVGSGITHTALGKVSYKVPGTATVGVACRKVIFDVETIAGGVKKTYMKGIVTIKPEVTI